MFLITKTPFRVLAAFLVALLAAGLRFHAASLLPIDYDEDDYLRSAQQFSHLIRTSDWPGFLNTNYRPEHPPLAKLAYALAIVDLPEQPLIADAAITAPPAKTLPEDLLQQAREEASVFGALTVFLLSLVNPLGGLVLAIHSFTIKYTSQVMLDGLSTLLSAGSVLAYVRYKQKKQTAWLMGSAVLLGLAADSKFLHGTVGIAILLDWLFGQCVFHKDQSQRLKEAKAIIGWGLLSVVVFFVANPYLWVDPIAKLHTALEAVRYTSTNVNVTLSNDPAWQPLVWMSTSVPWEENLPAFILRVDLFIFLFALFGVHRLWHIEPVYVIWLGVELLILLFWRTKWPQYTLVLTAPLALASAEGMTVAWQAIRKGWIERRYRDKEQLTTSRLRYVLPWLGPGLTFFAILTIFPLLFQLVVSFTDFNSLSIRDGFQGGIWHAVWGGLTGALPVVKADFPNRASTVNFTSLTSYSPVIDYITSSGVFIFDILWTVLSVLLQTLLGLGVALLLWQKHVRLSRAWQTLFILPWAIPEMIGALMWLNIFQPNTGWLALAADKFGEHMPFGFFIGWENSANLWLVVFLIPALWYGFPFMMLAASAGLKLIPHEVFDAAQIDGANTMQVFRHVTWPLLSPLLIPALIIRGIFAFNQFYLFQAFYFPESTLATLSYNLFNPSGFGSFNGQFGVSAVINILTVLILAGFVMLFNRWSRAGEGVQYA